MGTGLIRQLDIDPNIPPLSTALQEQLGLKLESTKNAVDVLVIDHSKNRRRINEPTPIDRGRVWQHERPVPCEERALLYGRACVSVVQRDIEPHEPGPEDRGLVVPRPPFAAV